MPRSSGHWLIYVLTTEGSYQQNLERPTNGPSDTMQYWISGSEAWDIRTFAIDKDIRVLQLDISGLQEIPLTYFEGVAQNIYGNLIRARYKIEVSNEDTDARLVQHVSNIGLFPKARWTELDFPLWLPEKTEYHSRGED